MAKPEIETSILGEADYGDWASFVMSAPSGSVYARPEYLDALCTATDARFRILTVRQGETTLGGVGLYERDGSFGRYVSPRLLLYYNGPVLREHETKYPSEQTARKLKALSAIEGAVRGAGYASVTLKPRSVVADIRPFLSAGWRTTHGYTYVVSIANLEETRSRIEQNLRRLIDRCGRSDFVFSEDDDFDSFFALHSLTMDRVDFQVYLPQAAFKKYYETLSRAGLAQLYFARLPDGRAVATQLVLRGHPVTHTVCAGADPEFMKSGVTAFLRWKVFERLSQLGHTANDLTDASLNAVTHFKSQLGGSLESWMELRAPETAKYRWGMRATRFIDQSRNAASGIVRRALKRG